MNDAGLAELVIDKGGKRLKSVPASMKKDEYVKEINEVKASLKGQFSRARLSLEKAMENRDVFTFGEAAELLGHPVINPLIRKLVFLTGDESGFLTEAGIRRTDGVEIPLAGDAALTIAHSHDLFRLAAWLDYQRFAFDNGLIQPFKQIFRELYTVNEDEKSEKTVSRRYAGHQIQPKKTVALLKGRGWTVDYENGLQKVYYKENVVVTMYALADWFSPADVEAPTLETVAFYDRKTGKPLELETINPVLFSEVMRDVDLVVSVAHVGGVDPMASHSTMEMRSVIVTESVRLMKLTNVTVGGHHARIRGSLGEYSVHLGSGLAHMMGRGALNILPVHGQHRGRLFLPFLDEDPKTAEINAKVLLLAEDTKIKDPTVMAQIK
jgi:thiol-disulfide isomerase/thioredoxin